MICNEWINVCNATLNFGYTNGHSSHLPRLNYGCKIECLYYSEENPRRFLQHTHHFKERYSSLSENSFVVSFSPLSHCYTLRGDLYPNTTPTYSECREWFKAWEALGICLNKSVRLGGCNQVILQDPKS